MLDDSTSPRLNGITRFSIPSRFLSSICALTRCSSKVERISLILCGSQYSAWYD